MRRTVVRSVSAADAVSDRVYKSDSPELNLLWAKPLRAFTSGSAPRPR